MAKLHQNDLGFQNPWVRARPERCAGSASTKRKRSQVVKQLTHILPFGDEAAATAVSDGRTGKRQVMATSHL